MSISSNFLFAVDGDLTVITLIAGGRRSGRHIIGYSVDTIFVADRDGL